MTATLPSLDKLKPNPDWASLPLFDRTGWSRVRFGDVVVNCTETCEPMEAGLERFIAMEHLEPGSLHVRSWGNVSDGTTFTRRCRPGQVLFGKRRAYQRKVAVAEFEAVVSGDIYVLAPKDTQRLLSELLPFLCLSERFFQHAVGTSAGSLSPRTNWNSLASFEFDLPPLDQQRRIAEILWAVDEIERHWISAQVEFNKTYRVLGDKMLETGILYCGGQLNQQVEKVPMKNWRLGELGKTYGGLAGKTRGDFGNGQPYIPYMNVFKNSRIDPGHLDLVAVRPDEKQNIVKYGDIFFTGSSETADEVGTCSVLLDDIGTSYLNSFTIGYRLNDFSTLVPDYARFLFRGSRFRTAVSPLAQGATRFNLTKRNLMSVEIDLPSVEVQRQIADCMSEFDSCSRDLGRHIVESKRNSLALVNTLMFLRR
jgi:type I restriction enzyme S subunit